MKSNNTYHVEVWRCPLFTCCHAEPWVLLSLGAFTLVLDCTFSNC